MLSSSGPYIALAALIIVVALAGVAYWTARRQDRIEAAQRAILGEGDSQDLVTHALDLEEQVRNLREAVTILSDEVEHYRHDLDGSLSNMAVVRFDAFRDSGGEQSASIALLDNYRSGIVISVYAGREFARIYVKYLDHGVPDRELAPEEEEAVRRAVPQALPRGELSRAPVSSFPRDVRQAVEQARLAAARPPEAASDAARAAGPGAGSARAAGGTVAGDAPAPRVAAGPYPGQPGPAPSPRVAAGPAQTAAAATPRPPAQPGPPAAAPTAAGAAAPQAVAAAEGAAAGRPAAAEPVEEDASAEPAAPRKTPKNDDWLGGDDLDF